VLRLDAPAGASRLAITPGLGARIGSFGGEIAVVEPGRCGRAATDPALALTTSRTGRAFYELSSTATGVECGAGCERSFADDPRLFDPYGVDVSCPEGGPNRAWVGFLRTPLGLSYIASIDLQTGVRKVASVGYGAVRSFAYDPVGDRLFFTSINAAGTAPLRWIQLSGGCDIELPESAGGCPVRATDLWSFMRGAELAGIALSNPSPGLPQRIYVAARIYNADYSDSTGVRPGFDVAGVLLVLEVGQALNGDLAIRLVDSFNVGLGASEVRVLPSRGSGVRDLVAITASEDGLLWIYDDEMGAMRDVFGRDPRTGAPELGRIPSGLAVQDLGTVNGVPTARVFVAAMQDGFVTPVDVPLTGSGPADLKTSLRVPAKVTP
jgi:hypothetical protein